VCREQVLIKFVEDFDVFSTRTKHRGVCFVQNHFPRRAGKPRALHVLSQVVGISPLCAMRFAYVVNKAFRQQ
jgi:hypothetical protein